MSATGGCLSTLSETSIGTLEGASLCTGGEVVQDLSSPSLDGSDAKSVVSSSSGPRRVLPVIDAVMKAPEQRGEEDVEAILRAVEYAPAFVFLPPMVRRQLCGSVEARVYDKDAVVVAAGEEINFLYVVMGQVQELQSCAEPPPNDVPAEDSSPSNADVSLQSFSAGDVVGMELSEDGEINEPTQLVSSKTYVATVPDTTVLWLSRDEYVRIAHPDNANMRRVEEGGNLVAVTQYRLVGKKQYAQVIIRGTPAKILELLFSGSEEGGSHFCEDILLTYRTFGIKPIELLSALNERANEHAARVESILQIWLEQHWFDFDDPEMVTLLASLLGKVSAGPGLSFPLANIVRVHIPSLQKGHTALSEILALLIPDLFISPSPQLSSHTSEQLDNISIASCESPFGSRRNSTAGESSSSISPGVTHCHYSFGDIPSSETSTIHESFPCSLSSASTLDKEPAGDDSSANGRRRSIGPDDGHGDSPTSWKRSSVFRRKRHQMKRGSSVQLMPIKVYRPDGMSRILACSAEDTTAKVIQQAVSSFGMDQPTDQFSLVCVSASRPDMVKQVVLPAKLSPITKVKVDSRIYLKHTSFTGHVTNDETTEEIMEQGEVNLLTIELKELVRALTVDDFDLFQSVLPIEYVADLWELKVPVPEGKLHKLEDSSNWQMFWVATEICREPDIAQRALLIRNFVQIAVFCRRCHNFNTMCAVISGLSYAPVARLKQTWERVPRKMIQMFEDMQQLLNPSRNMANYRQMLSSESVHPPLLPFIPIVKKDLAFVHLGNKSTIDGLVNVDKLRMVANEVRKLSQYCSVKYDSDSMLTGLRPAGSEYVSSHSDSNALKKAHQAWVSKTRLKHYLENLEVIRDEAQLDLMSREVETGDRPNSCDGRDADRPILNKHSSFRGSVVRNTSLRMAKAFKNIAARR